MTRDRPPFRGDHVGSLLRPAALKTARENILGAQTADQHLGPHGNQELRAVEDECVKEVAAMQERAGLRATTDGEFRRRSWWLEMVMTWKGFTADRQDASSPFAWKNEDGKQQDFSHLRIDNKIEWQPSAVVEGFKFLRDNTSLVPKVTMPAPPVIHCFAGGDLNSFGQFGVWRDDPGSPSNQYICGWFPHYDIRWFCHDHAEFACIFAAV